MAVTTASRLWDSRADLLQDSLDHFFGTAEPQLYNNAYPMGAQDNQTFNYWWLAHLIDVRLDAYERSGESARLEQAQAVYHNILERNHGSLFNDYFDDMLWYALAIVRLFDATGRPQYLAASIAIWEHVIAQGWNEEQGASLAWRKQQLYYKNTPANGPLIILGCRLHARDRRPSRPQYLEYAQTAFNWLTQTLVNPATGFVEDGINREQDGRVDTHWRFTYNQGLYVGAAVELAQATSSTDLIDIAARTATTTISELATAGVFADEGAGGDEGLFKGIYYRYLGLLLDQLEESDQSRTLRDFVRVSTDILWRQAPPAAGYYLAANDWTGPAQRRMSYSTELSAIMATELRARMENIGRSGP